MKNVKSNFKEIVLLLIVVLLLFTGYSNAEENQNIKNDVLNNVVDNSTYDIKSNEKYFGTLDMNLWNLHVGQDNNGYYMNGNVDVTQWINNAPGPISIKPKIQLISKDGKIVKDFYVEYRKGYSWGSEYYFYLDIDGIDIWKEYKIQITDVDANNTNTTKYKEAKIANWKIGNYWEFNVETKNNLISFKNPSEYYGIIDANLWRMHSDYDNNGYYIDGNIDICNWIDNQTKPLKQMPKIQLVSTDGSVVKDFYVEYRKGYSYGAEYYFYLDIDGIDVWKEYKIKIVDTDSNNKNSSNSKETYIEDGKYGSYWEYIIGVSESIIYFGNTNYVGVIDCNLWNIKSGKNNTGYYIEGNIDVSEWVGSQTIAPLGKPKIQLVSTDGKIVKDFYIEYKKGYDWGTQYYIYLNIDGIDVWKEYNIKLTDTSHKNNSPIKTKNAKFNTLKLGNYWEYDIYTENEILSFLISTPKVEYSTLLQQIGWTNYVNNENISGSPFSGKNICSFKIKLYGLVNSNQHIVYKVYEQGNGWLESVKDGEEARN